MGERVSDSWRYADRALHLHPGVELEARGAVVNFHDPWVPVIPETREFSHLAGRKSVAWQPERFAKQFDAAVVVTDHEQIDYRALSRALDLIVDTRNALHGIGESRGVVIKA